MLANLITTVKYAYVQVLTCQFRSPILCGSEWIRY